jgi:lipid II:glycine glycyltransferase (peptidoglycan interpeptide bridge formation enzyme)
VTTTLEGTSLHVRTLSTREHLTFLLGRASSFLQWPSRGEVKVDSRAESIGWIDGGELVGAGLVLYRRPPGFERSFAYLPKGPVLDWYTGEAASWLDPMVEHLRSENPFTVRMGPPVVVRRWTAETIRNAIAVGEAKRLCDVPTTAEDPQARDLAASLRATGWRPDRSKGGFGRIQPRHRVQVPLAGRTLDEVFAGCDKASWQRNIRKAERAGVEVSRGSDQDLSIFHRLCLETAGRKRFGPRSLEYFQQMAIVMTAEDPNRFRLYLARHDDDVLAATVTVTLGEHVWSTYTGSAGYKREVRASNAIQWRMLSDAYSAGASVYDLRGVSDTLDPADPLFGVTRFKIGSGGHVAACLGEWSYPLDEVLYEAFEQYLTR